MVILIPAIRHSSKAIPSKFPKVPDNFMLVEKKDHGKLPSFIGDNLYRCPIEFENTSDRRRWFSKDSLGDRCGHWLGNVLGRHDCRFLAKEMLEIMLSILYIRQQPTDLITAV